jgi:hypothetical protein
MKGLGILGHGRNPAAIIRALAYVLAAPKSVEAASDAAQTVDIARRH